MFLGVPKILENNIYNPLFGLYPTTEFLSLINPKFAESIFPPKCSSTELIGK
jgi:hypothetical protein